MRHIDGAIGGTSHRRRISILETNTADGVSTCGTQIGCTNKMLAIAIVGTGIDRHIVCGGSTVGTCHNCVAGSSGIGVPLNAG